MPTFSNPLYANGVPTYSNEVGALGEVFKALAPNPLRDLQIQGYANNTRLSKLKGDVIQNQQDSLPGLAAAFGPGGDLQQAIPQAILGGQLKNLPNIIKAVPAGYSFKALGPGGNANVDQSVLATVMGGAGEDVAHSKYGFDANQERQTNEANQKNDTAIYGIDTRSADSRYGTDVGATTARRGQDIGAENSTYGANLQFLKAGGRGAGGTGAGGGTTGGGAAAGELNPKGVSELDSALANVLTGRVVPDADRADLAARTQAYYLAQPKGGRNFQLAANQAVADIQQGNDLPSSTNNHWYKKDELLTKPADQRAPLPQPWQPPPKVAAGGAGAGGLSPVAQAVLAGNPNLRRPLSAAQLNAAAPAPVAAPAAAPSDGIITANSPADLAGLPSGTPFKTPDGRVKYVP